jgi:hypothetical protein
MVQTWIKKLLMGQVFCILNDAAGAIDHLAYKDEDINKVFRKMIKRKPTSRPDLSKIIRKKYWEYFVKL